MNALAQFLFGESQIRDAFDALPDDIAAMFQEAEAQDKLSGKKEPLASALKSTGISSSSLQLDPDGFMATVKDGLEYQEICAKLSEVGVINKLAELGWVAVTLGDVAMTREEPEYRIRFIEIDVSDTDSADSAENVQSILKAAHDFANERELPKADENPGFKPGTASIGSQKDGESVQVPPIRKSKSEGLVDALLADPGEGLVKVLERVISEKSKRRLEPPVAKRHHTAVHGRMKRALNKPVSGHAES